MLSDDTILKIIEACDKQAELDDVMDLGTYGLRALAVHTLGLRQGLRNLSTRVPQGSELQQDMLKLIGED